ncbi:hypothetical protein [Paenibacillus lautus]|uniref:hypothetical protein n=1 Tax=Paenibacillus lautus TaxID=1401 RepID=UPI001C7D2363|nr:hypothetical protein [Paenibacillus lautus]MBX4152449.1 hypothetical protein [Paenibacillus lautus]
MRLATVLEYDFKSKVTEADLRVKSATSYEDDLGKVLNKLLDLTSQEEVKRLIQLISEHQLNVLATLLLDYHQETYGKSQLEASDSSKHT